MRYINFELSGENLRPKLLTYCSTRFPDFKIYGNDTFSGFRFRDHGGERHVLILFSQEEKDKAVVNLGLAEYHFNLPFDRAFDKLFVDVEFKKFEDWSEKWNLTISNKQVGVKPEHVMTNQS